VPESFSSPSAQEVFGHRFSEPFSRDVGKIGEGQVDFGGGSEEPFLADVVAHHH